MPTSREEMQTLRVKYIMKKNKENSKFSEHFLTEQPSITQTPEPTESDNDETKITSNIPQVPQNRDYPDYEEEKRQDQERLTMTLKLPLSSRKILKTSY